MAGKRRQSSQYPKSTPDAWTPFFLSAWIRNMAKLWTRESGGRWTEAGKGGGREGREGALLCPMPSTRAGKAAARNKPAGLGMSFTTVVSHTVGCMRNSRAWGVPCRILQRVTDTLEVHRIMRAKPSTWGNKFG